MVRGLQVAGEANLAERGYILRAFAYLRDESRKTDKNIRYRYKNNPYAKAKSKAIFRLLASKSKAPVYISLKDTRTNITYYVMSNEVRHLGDLYGEDSSVAALQRSALLRNDIILFRKIK